MRQYLHGNVHESYTTVLDDFPKAWKDRTPEATERLLEYGAGDFQHHSMVFLKTAEEGPRLVRSVCVRKRNALSPSYYVHKYGFNIPTKQLLEEYDAFLRMPFFSEEEFDRVAAGENDVKPTMRWSGEPVPIDRSVLHAVLLGIVRCWYSGAEPVVVAVPEGVDYNSYCFGAVSKIYSYLPVGIRAQAGFMTYTAPQSASRNAALFFLPEGTAGNAVSLAEPNNASQALMEQFLPKSLAEMVKRLVEEKDEDERRKYLEQIRVNVETDPQSGELLPRLQSVHYSTYLDNTDLLDPVTSQEQFDRQLKFAKNLNSLSPRLKELFLKNLDARISAEALNSFGLNLIKGDTTLQIYGERIAGLEPLVRHSEKMREQAKEKLDGIFKEFLSQTDTPELLNPLADQLNALERGKNPFLDEEMRNAYRLLIDGKRGVFHREMAAAYVAEAIQSLDRADTQNIPDMDQKLREITLVLKRKLADLQIDASKEMAPFEAAKSGCRTKRILAELQMPDNGELTQEGYENELNHLNALHKYLSGRLDDTQLAEKAADAIRELNKRYENSRSRQNKQFGDLLEQGCSYFQLLEKAQAHLRAYPKLPAEMERKMREVFARRRPATMEAYQREYWGYYQRALVISAAASLGRLVGTQILDDLKFFAERDLHIDVTNRSLYSILKEIHEASAQAGLLGGKAEKVWLSGGRTESEFSADRLTEAIWAFSHASSGALMPLSRSQLKYLLEVLTYAKLSAQEKLRIFQYLMDQKCGELIDLFKEKILCWPCKNDRELEEKVRALLAQEKYNSFARQFGLPVLSGEDQKPEKKPAHKDNADSCGGMTRFPEAIKMPAFNGATVEAGAPKGNASPQSGAYYGSGGTQTDSGTLAEKAKSKSVHNEKLLVPGEAASLPVGQEAKKQPAAQQTEDKMQRGWERPRESRDGEQAEAADAQYSAEPDDRNRWEIPGFAERLTGWIIMGAAVLAIILAVLLAGGKENKEPKPPAESTSAAEEKDPTKPDDQTTAAPTDGVTTAPTTVPATAPTTEPPVYNDSIPVYYRICNAAGGEGETWKESLASMGIGENAWLILYENGTGVINLDGTQKRIFHGDGIFWDNDRVYAFAVDENKIFRYAPDHSGLELFFEPVEEAPPSTFIREELCPKEIRDILTGEWVGVIDADTRCPVPGEATARVRIQFDEDGRCRPEITFDGYTGEGIRDVTALLIPESRKLMLYGDFEGVPFLADSSITAGDNTLLLWLRIGDPTSPNAYTLSARLVRAEDE